MDGAIDAVGDGFVHGGGGWGSSFVAIDHRLRPQRGRRRVSTQCVCGGEAVRGDGACASNPKGRGERVRFAPRQIKRVDGGLLT